MQKMLTWVQFPFSSELVMVVEGHRTKTTGSDVPKMSHIEGGQVPLANLEVQNVNLLKVSVFN